MNLLAIIGSPRKGKATDSLVDAAINGALKKSPDVSVKKMYLFDYNINYIKDCLTSWKSDTKGPVAKCMISDKMDKIKKEQH